MTGTPPEPRVFSPRLEAIGSLIVRLVVSFAGAWGAFTLINRLAEDAKAGGPDHSAMHYAVLGLLALICICIAGGKHAIVVLDHLFPGISGLLRARFPTPPAPPAPPAAP